jgi:hypothetical protein
LFPNVMYGNFICSSFFKKNKTYLPLKHRLVYLFPLFFVIANDFSGWIPFYPEYSW